LTGTVDHGEPMIIAERNYPPLHLLRRDLFDGHDIGVNGMPKQTGMYWKIRENSKTRNYEPYAVARFDAPSRDGLGLRIIEGVDAHRVVPLDHGSVIH
jgi:hypothetical protein